MQRGAGLARRSKVEAVADEIREVADGRGVRRRCHGRSPGERLREDFTAKFNGPLHILINNAGINIRKPLTDFTLAEWHRVMDTNLTSVFLSAARSCR